MRTEVAKHQATEEYAADIQAKDRQTGNKSIATKCQVSYSMKLLLALALIVTFLEIAFTTFAFHIKVIEGRIWIATDKFE